MVGSGEWEVGGWRKNVSKRTLFPVRKRVQRETRETQVTLVGFLEVPMIFLLFFSRNFVYYKMGIKTVDPFWERVKRLMKAHKISQKEFSAYIGVSFQTLRCWLHYNRIPDAYTSCDIAEALGVSVEFLVRGVDGKAMENREKEALIRKAAAAEIGKMSKIIRKNARLIG